jgi:manganese-dependent inorganic pyrophosphatase
MEKIYVFGHKKPDTDSVAASISVSYLKNKLGLNTEPRVLGDINNETQFVLDYFNMKTPEYLNDVKLQIKDVNYHKDYYINEKASIKQAYDYMIEKGITGVPLVDENKKFVNLVTLKIIVNNLISGDFEQLDTSYENILNTLNGEEILKFDDKISGKLNVASFRSTTFMNNVSLDPKDILIVGDRHSIIEYAVNSKIKLLIITGKGLIKEEHLNIAKKNKVNIIRTDLSTFNTTKIINLSNYISSLTKSLEPYTFNYNDYYDDFIDKSYKLKHNNYPVIDDNGICNGLIRITDIDDKNKKKVILVDHNEITQSADGIEEAEILEIIDHHKIGNFSSILPINFRNMPVGSSNTIIYQLFKENNVEIPKNIAGVMLSGILSDTLIFKSPTTTEYDKIAVNDLAKIAGVNYETYGLEMLKAGSSVNGKTLEEIIYTDFKNFNVNNKKIAVCQIFTVDPDSINKDKDKYIEILNNIAKFNEYYILCFLVTDIMKNGSYFYFNDTATNILGNCFNIEDFKQGIYMDDVVSRKKQVIPPMINYIEKN